MNAATGSGTKKEPANPGDKESKTKPSENLTGTGRGDAATLGALAYGGYCGARDWKAFNGDPMPKFEEQSPELQEAWNKAAFAVADNVRLANLKAAITAPRAPMMVPHHLGRGAIMAAGGKRLVLLHVQSYGPVVSGRDEDCGISFYGYTGSGHSHDIGQWIPPTTEAGKNLPLEARKKLRDEMLEALDDFFGVGGPI